MEGAVDGSGLEASFLARRGPGFRLELSLSIPPGRTVALLGPNGAGKSTAVDVLAGLLPAESGSITLGGVTLDEPATDRFVPPEQALGL